MARAAGTLKRYRQVLDKDIISGVGELRIREATVSRMDGFIKRKSADVGPATAKLCAVLLTGMFDLAARHDTIRINPMRSVAHITTERSEIRAYTMAEVAAMRRIFAEWDAGRDKRGMKRTADLADVVDVYLATGCRTGEVLGLQWSDIDLETTPPRVTISGTVASDGDGHLVIQPATKSGKSRELTLPPFAVKMLQRRRSEAVTNFVFPSSTGTLRSPSNFRLQWHAALKGTPFEGSIPKTFRSTVATLISERTNAESAKKQLGHSSVTVTEGHYIKPSNKAPDLTATLEMFNSEIEIHE